MPGKKKPSEKVIENAILTYLNYLEGCFAWKNNTMGVYDPVKKTYRKNMNRFAISGVSDILGIYKGKMVAIEVKTAKGKLSKEQGNFLRRIEKLGGIAGVARSIDDARRIMHGGKNEDATEAVPE